MGLTYYYEFTAPAETGADQLELFLRDVEKLAESLGFGPTMVLNVPFDTGERRDFARHLGGSFILEDERLKGVVLPAGGLVRDHDLVHGNCRLIPVHGVLLVVTDGQRGETCFGFFKYPAEILDVHGNLIADTGLQGRWWFRDHLKMPDPRYRQIVRRFQDAGYAVDVHDDFA